MKFGICLVFFLFSVSCTVTKRVHRPGFHVEWRKHYSQSNVSDTSGEKLENPGQAKEQRSELPSDLNTTSADSLVSKEANTSIAPERRTYQPIANTFETVKESFAAAFQKQSNAIAVQKSTPLPYIYVQGKNLQIWGYAFLGFGVLLILGSVFLVFGTNGFSGLYNSLVFGGNGLAAGILGFLLFLLILLVVFLFAVIVEFGLGGPTNGFIVGLAFLVGGGVLLIWGSWLRGRQEGE